MVFFCRYFVQGQESSKNVVSIGINFSAQPRFDFYDLSPGVSIEYERLLNNYFSVGLDIGMEMSFIWPYAEIQGHWYPWAKMFFVGFGLGVFGWFLTISLDIGWKINIGKANRLVIISSTAVRKFLGDIGQPFYYIFIPNIVEFCLKIGYKF